MEEPSVGSQQIAIQIASRELTVAPGSSASVPLYLHNQSQAPGSYILTVAGIPSTWVSVPSHMIQLAAGEQQEALLTIQPPPVPMGRAGRFEVVIGLASQEIPQQAAEATCTLTVAQFVAPGRIGMLLASAEFAAAPGESVAIPVVLLNQGLESDIVNLAVEGIPSSWVSSSMASAPLSPGQELEVTLTVRPTSTGEGGAGRHPFRILAASQASPGQVTAADCVLSIASVSQFSSDLRPQRIEAGAPARVTVENQGNAEDVYTLTWQSPDDGLDFDPLVTQQLHILPGEVSMAEFSARPRSRPLFGGEQVLPFTTRVEATGGGTRNHNGEVVAKAMIPTWLVAAVLVAILACACLSVLGVGLGGLLDQAPPQAPEATAPPGQDQPAEPPADQPTEPPAEQPTEPPQEQPTEPPPEQPTEPPAGEQPPEEPPAAEQLPAEPDKGGLVCAPLAGALVLAPLLVIGKKNGNRRSSNK